MVRLRLHRLDKSHHDSNRNVLHRATKRESIVYNITDGIGITMMNRNINSALKQPQSDNRINRHEVTIVTVRSSNRLVLPQHRDRHSDTRKTVDECLIRLIRLLIVLVCDTQRTYTGLPHERRDADMYLTVPWSISKGGIMTISNRHSTARILQHAEQERMLVRTSILTKARRHRRDRGGRAVTRARRCTGMGFSSPTEGGVAVFPPLSPSFHAPTSGESPA